MTHSGTLATQATHEPLLSNRFLLKSLSFMAAMAGMTGLLVVGGHSLGKRMTLAGHTDSLEIMRLDIGRHRLQLPANVIRFETQRHNGTTDRADLYLLWPDMTGFSRARSDRFNNLRKSRDLVFLDVTQSVMSKDMSGRVEPIYSHYFAPGSVDAGHGLTLHRFKAEAGYDRDVLLTGKTSAGRNYAVRCILPQVPAEATSGDCQRDVQVGTDLSLLYRFSSDLLPEWEKLDADITAYIGSHLAKSGEQDG